jgi:hypothetical protein
MDWKIGNKMDSTSYASVCKQAFCNVYCVSSSHVDNVVRDIKKGIHVTEPVFNDKSKIDLSIFPKLREIAKGFGLYLSRTQVAAAKLPNSPTVLTAYGWMAAHFDLIGDMAPNRDGEIHLEPCHIVEVYGEYFVDMQNADVGSVHVDTFASIWNNCFDHVKIREFKAVSGKCACCANLSTLRKTFKSQRDREYVKMMHALHRSTYMGERIAYATRRNRAIMEKSRYLSTIADGMQQGHNMLPHMANQNVWQDCLPQHLQGVLNHNRGLKMYRTFHNVNNCANVAMYAWLDTLEKVHAEEGKLPDTIYHQIDGGSENTAKAWFALCELLVARRLCKRVVLTRLMVGHTHEDIDSKFGILWKKIRHKYVYTPQQYNTKIINSLSTKKRECEVIDVFAVPDFKKLLDDYVDPSFRAQSKCEKTQLQWSFEACTPDDYFKNGVKVFYRAYCADEVCQIIEDNTKQCGVEAKVCDVFDFPVRDEKDGILVDGMTVLQSLPSKKPDPYPFVPNSREILDSVLLKVRQEFTTCHPKLVAEWEDWATKEAPASDSVEQYLTRKPLHIPLGDLLFSDKPVDQTVIDANWDTSLTSAKLQRMRTTDCAQWTRWGFQREDHSVENFARVQLVEADGNNTAVEVNALPEKPKFFRAWKRKQKKKADEVGEFHFVLGRLGGKININAPLTVEGQLIWLTNGSCRIYWKHKKKPEEFDLAEIDSTFQSGLAMGWYCYGRIVSPAGGNSVKGEILLEDKHGVPLVSQTWPPTSGHEEVDIPITVHVAPVSQEDVPITVAPVSQEDVPITVAPVTQEEIAITIAPVAQEEMSTTVAPVTQEEIAITVAPVAQEEMSITVAPVAQAEIPITVAPVPQVRKKRKCSDKWEGYVESICGVLSNNILTTKRQRNKNVQKY